MQHRATFTAAGVLPEKLVVVPQGIDALQLDPQQYEPLVLRDLAGTQLVTGSVDPFSTQTGQPFGELLSPAYLHQIQAGSCETVNLSGSH